ncbi:MAG TPA: hypothetical protein VF921_05115, partial [Vicinamibacterales bacterium]
LRRSTPGSAPPISATPTPRPTCGWCRSSPPSAGGPHDAFTAESGVLYIHPGLDISTEVIKRLDAQPKK